MAMQRTDLQLQPRPIRYTQNGFRSVSDQDTLSRIDELLLSTSLNLRFERQWIPGNPFIHQQIIYFRPGESTQAEEVYHGKGLSEDQCLISATLEFVERFCARALGDETLIKASYLDVEGHARDPVEFILPLDTCYSPDLPIWWMWGYSLTCEQPVMVPANLVFCPYVAATPEEEISSSDSNGLAAGNCIEEAILHGLMEVIERDARLIMEYNRLVMPDVSCDPSGSDPVSEVLKVLDRIGIQCWIKDITSDLAIPSFGVLLRGVCEGKETFGHASGTHLDPEVALVRALTEAIQLYPRCGNYDTWMGSDPIDHLREPSCEAMRARPDGGFECDDLKPAIEYCVDLLGRFGAEVIVVDLSRPEMKFPVVRVCVTNLQPIMLAHAPRFSRRLFEVPVLMGYRDRPLGPEEIVLRELCGYRPS